jgi:hypothetical protein
VREVVGHRVARLGEETEHALSIAAVIGRDFEVELLARLLGTEEDWLLDLLEGAIRAGLVSESGHEAGQYRFVHALIQHTLYQDLGPSRRQRAHRRVAEALETTGTDNDVQPAELARHWIAATQPSDAVKALYYGTRAGDAALAAFAPLDAIGWYSQALELQGRRGAPDDRERCSLLVRLGTARRQALQPEYRQTLADAAALAERLDDSELLAEAALAAAWGHLRLSEADTEQIAVLESALSSVGDTNSTLRAKLLVALAEVTDARAWKRRRDMATEAVTLARGLGEDATILDVLTTSYGFRAQPESALARMLETEEAIALADRLGDPSARWTSRYNRHHASMEVGNLEEADRVLDEMSLLAKQGGLGWWLAWPVVCRAGRLTLSGDLAGAEAANEEAFELGSRGPAPEGALAAYGGLLFEIRSAQGRLEEIVDVFSEAAAANPAIAALRAALVAMYCAVSRLDEARTLFEHDVANGFAEVPRDQVWTTAMMHFADSAVNLRHHLASEVLYDQLRPFVDLVIYPLGPVLGSLARPAARLAHFLDNDQEAESLFRAALATHEHLESPYWIARTELEYADLLVDRAMLSDLAVARDLTGKALSAAKDFRFRALEQKAERLLASFA